MKDKRKQQGPVDKCSLEQQFHISNVIGKQADKMLLSLEIIKIIYWTKHYNFSGIQKGIVVPINFSQFFM